MKLHKTFIFNNQSIETDYLDGFVYTTPYSLEMELGLQETQAAAEMSAAGQRESFELAEKEVIARPGGPVEAIQSTPSFFATAEGFYDYDNFRYIYQYKDHLGNIRLNFGRDANGNLFKEDSNDYYPFGLNFINPLGGALQVYNPSATYKNYKYNGKELQETGMYDYGARMYMPDISRWGVIDNKAEKYSSMSPYTYAGNNPIAFIDPDGNDVIPWFVNSIRDNGKLRATKNYATKEFIKAMSDFAKTDYGKSYLLQFMKKGQSVFGLKASTNGKHSNKNLNLINLNLRYATSMERGNTFIDDGGVWEGKIVYPHINIKTGAKSENVDVYFDTLGLDQFELGETIAHELVLHGNNFEDYAEAVANNESTDNLSNSDEEHKAIATQNRSNKNFRSYKWVMEQLKAANAKYELIEKKEQKKYEELYKINNKK